MHQHNLCIRGFLHSGCISSGEIQVHSPTGRCINYQAAMAVTLHGGKFYCIRDTDKYLELGISHVGTIYTHNLSHFTHWNLIDKSPMNFYGSFVLFGPLVDFFVLQGL